MEIVAGPVYEFRSSNFCSYTERSDNGDMGNYHCHNFYELYYLERGQRDYLVGQINYPVTEGCFVLVKPHRAFRRLAHFFAVARGKQGKRHCVRRFLLLDTDKVCPSENIAPLVVAAKF